MDEPPSTPHRRRPRYPGKNPRRFEHKYKELDPEQHPDTVAKVLASGKTPAGSHLPIMVGEILEVLRPRPGEFAVDCTLGHGGHAQAILECLQPGGHLLALDADPLELPRTAERLHSAGFGPEQLTIIKSNFAGLPAVLTKVGHTGADLVIADLGVSSMQLDNPARGFSTKAEGPLDMRMNPKRGLTAAQWLQKVSPDKLARILAENSDEPHAQLLGRILAGHDFATTADLATAIQSALTSLPPAERDLSVRRVFQAIRIEVNEEFTALDALLRVLPHCLNPGGRLAILTFHSGEDRRVKKALQSAHQEGLYQEIARRVVRASPAERHANPRSTAAKLRWAVRPL
jgi:16S rRNA (cytosine1402-N4)-methyltransferase